MKGQLSLHLEIPLEVDTDHYDCVTLHEAIDKLLEDSESLLTLVEAELENRDWSELSLHVEVAKANRGN